MAHVHAWPRALPAAAVGGGTRRELERRGVASVLAPQAGADSEALLALPAMQQVAGKRIVFRGQGGRELLGDTLRNRGAQVVYAAGYRRTRPKGERRWHEGEIDAITVSSSQGLANLFELLDPPFLRARPLLVPHPRVAGNAREQAVREVVVAGPPTSRCSRRWWLYDPMADAPARSRSLILALIAVALAAGLATLYWLADARNRIGATQEELARRLRDIEHDAREARSVARQSHEAMREAHVRLAQLDARLAESQSQSLALEALYQELSRNRDEWQLAEIEQILAIASQQLQLAGNVRAALLALQLAEARLAKADRPQFAPVRRRARARHRAPQGRSGARHRGHERTHRQFGRGGRFALPLAFDERSAAVKEKSAVPEGAGFWSRLGSEGGASSSSSSWCARSAPGAAARAAPAVVLPAREPAAAPAERAAIAARAR